MVALGAAGGYYYNSTQEFKTKTVPRTPGSAPSGNQKKDIDYQKIYNEIADMLDEDSEYVIWWEKKKKPYRTSHFVCFFYYSNC